MLRDVQFLEFKPSEIAAAAFMMALNANLDTPLSKALEVELLDTEMINVESFFHENTIRIRFNCSTSDIDTPSQASSKKAWDAIGPLNRWADSIEQLTQLNRSEDV